MAVIGQKTNPFNTVIINQFVCLFLGGVGEVEIVPVANPVKNACFQQFAFIACRNFVEDLVCKYNLFG